MSESGERTSGSAQDLPGILPVALWALALVVLAVVFAACAAGTGSNGESAGESDGESDGASAGPAASPGAASTSAYDETAGTDEPVGDDDGDGLPPDGGDRVPTAESDVDRAPLREVDDPARLAANREAFTRLGPSLGVDGSVDLRVVAPVSGDEIDTSGAASADAAERIGAIWDRMVELFPAEQRRSIAVLTLDAAPDEFGGGADALPLDEMGERWTIGISDRLPPDQLDHVLIHEFAHMLTLGADQFEAPDGACSTYENTFGGCARSDSIAARFMDRFWPDEVVAAAGAAFETGESIAGRFPGRFVSEYAGTAPDEDLAEVFTFFVFSDRPTGDSIVDQKLLMMWETPGMVELREQIRAGDPVPL